jgi:hypothetical protein
MKTQSQILTFFALHQANGFLSNVAQRAPTCLNSSYMPGMDTRPQTDTYRQGSPDMGYASNLEDRLANLESGRDSASYQAPEGSYSPSRQIFDNKTPLKVQGGSLKTWTFNSAAVEAVHVVMRTEGRPLDADIELWQGPDNTPCKMRVYVEDGGDRPFSCMIATPRGPSTVALRNIGHLEFPLQACVVADTPEIVAPSTSMMDFADEPLIIQGGALRTCPFDPSVDSVQVLLNTDGRPLNARIELLQGPNNIKEVVELYTEDGLDRPFSMVLETPGSGNVIRICNTATVEFPLTAGVEAYTMNNEYSDFEPVLGGDSNEGFLSSRR